MSSSSSDSESEDEGFKGKSSDDWLSTALGTAGSRGQGSRRQAKMDEKKKREELNQRLLASRQWKPKTEVVSDPQGKSDHSGSLSSSINPSTTHTPNDFGVSWMQRALDRVYQKAKEENLPPEEVAAERWGSLDKLKQMLTEAKEKLRKADQGNSHGSSSSRGLFSSSHEPSSSSREGREGRRDHHRHRSDRREDRHKSDPREDDQRRPERRDDDRYRSDKRSKDREEPERHSGDWRQESYRSDKRSKDREESERHSGDWRQERDSMRGKDPKREWEAKDSGKEKEEWETRDRGKEKEEYARVEPSSAKVYTVQLPPATSSQEPVEDEAEEPKPLTDTEKNAIHAKILKAEMFGNTKLVQELKAKLDHDQARPGVSVSQKLDHGQPRPGVSVSQEGVSVSQEGVRRINVYKRLNEDEMSIKELFMREKTLDTEKDGQMFARRSLKSINPSKFNPDDEYDIEPKEKRSRDEVVREEERKEVECNNCYSKYPKRLILAFGEETFLCLGQNEPLVDGHVCIRSMDHVPTSLVSADLDVQGEVDRMKQALVQMFSAVSKSVIFTECHRKSRNHDSHMVIECIPIPIQLLTEARLYFKKAILDSETEWSINKKLVELKGKHVARMVS